MPNRTASLFFWADDGIVGTPKTSLYQWDVDDNGLIGAHPVSILNNTFGWLVRGLDVSPDGKYLLFTGQNEIFFVDLTAMPSGPELVWRLSTAISNNETPRFLAVGHNSKIFHTVDVNSFAIGVTMGQIVSSDLTLFKSGERQFTNSSALWWFNSYIGESGNFGLAVDPSPYGDSRIRLYWCGNKNGVGGLSWMTLNPSLVTGGIATDPKFSGAQPRFMAGKNRGIVFPCTTASGQDVVIGNADPTNTQFIETGRFTLTGPNLGHFVQASIVGDYIYLAAPDGLYQFHTKCGGNPTLMFKWKTDYTGPQLATCFA